MSDSMALKSLNYAARLVIYGAYYPWLRHLCPFFKEEFFVTHYKGRRKSLTL